MQVSVQTLPMTKVRVNTSSKNNVARMKLFRCAQWLRGHSATLRRLRCQRFTASSSSAPLPLSGIRVVDLSRVLAGPHCSQLLGDLGAEIIKIEHPNGGDETRSWGPPFTAASSSSAYYLSCNRNKKSISIDFKSKSGQEILHKLIAESDVLLNNFIPGTLQRYKLDFDHLRHHINPSLIYCSITGFGDDGPYRLRNGYDLVIQAMGGMMHVTGTEETPCKTGVC